jgi:ribosomal protein L37AE/L43A
MIYNVKGIACASEDCHSHAVTYCLNGNWVCRECSDKVIKSYLAARPDDNVITLELNRGNQIKS